jgi:hypothetical protein
MRAESWPAAQRAWRRHYGLSVSMSALPALRKTSSRLRYRRLDRQICSIALWTPTTSSVGVTIQIVPPICTDRAWERGKLFVHVRLACVRAIRQGPSLKGTAAVAAGAVSGFGQQQPRRKRDCRNAAALRPQAASPAINLPGRSMTSSPDRCHGGPPAAA